MIRIEVLLLDGNSFLSFPFGVDLFGLLRYSPS
jgi:hypothetical protein